MLASTTGSWDWRRELRDLCLSGALLGGSWAVICGAVSPLINSGVVCIVTLLPTPLRTTHEPPSKALTLNLQPLDDISRVCILSGEYRNIEVRNKPLTPCYWTKLPTLNPKPQRNLNPKSPKNTIFGMFKLRQPSTHLSQCIEVKPEWLLEAGRSIGEPYFLLRAQLRISWGSWGLRLTGLLKA